MRVARRPPKSAVGIRIADDRDGRIGQSARKLFEMARQALGQFDAFDLIARQRGDDQHLPLALAEPAIFDHPVLDAARQGLPGFRRLRDAPPTQARPQAGARGAGPRSSMHALSPASPGANNAPQTYLTAEKGQIDVIAEVRPHFYNTEAIAFIRGDADQGELEQRQIQKRSEVRTNSMDNWFALTVLAILLLGLLVLYIWAVAWAIGDAQKRGQTGCLPMLLFYLFGPLAVAAWLVIRPYNRLTDKKFDEYQNPEDAFAAACRLDALGDWDVAVVLYRATGQRWPEHRSYAERCIEQIERKQAAS